MCQGNPRCNFILVEEQETEPFIEVARSWHEGRCKKTWAACHRGGTYVCMEGPQFSTLAESEEHRRAGFALIGMTALPEAKLAREAEIAYAMLALVTDYDCWHPGHEVVSVESVIKVLHANAALAQEVIRQLVPMIGDGFESPAHRALATAIVTDRKYIPAATLERVKLLVGKYLG